MATDPKKLFDLLLAVDNPPEVAKPNKDTEDLVQEIFEQAGSHRKLLIIFYVSYTTAFSVLVMGLIIAQAIVRYINHDSSIELIPEWSLNIIVAGMFGQFIGLLTIVTKKVWEFKPFLDHAKNGLHPKSKK